MATRTRITAEEYFARPDDDRFTQLIDGELVVNAPRWEHQAIVGALYAELRAWTRAAPGRGRAALGVAVRMGDLDVYVPDVVWLPDAAVPARNAAYLPPVPDLVVEVRSPSTWRYDVGRKKAAYEAAGARELWLVDHPAEVVLIFRRSAPGAPTFDEALEAGRGETLRSPLLPGFSLPVDALLDETWT